MTEFAIFIPARLGSTRLSRKMLRKIGDHPLICHVTNRALLSSINQVIVATDSQEIAEAISNSNAQCIMTSVDHQTGSDRIFEALQKLDHSAIEFVINLQGDIPFVDHNVLNLLKSNIKDTDFDILTVASPITDQNQINNPNVVKIAMTLNQEGTMGNALYFSRQAIPFNANTYYEHTGIYLYRKEALEKFVALKQTELELQERLEQLRALENGMKIGVVITDKAPISVDTIEDFENAVKQHNVTQNSGAKYK